MKLNAKTLMIAGIVVGAMILEAAVIYFMLPAPQTTAAPSPDAQNKPAEPEVAVSDDTGEVPIDSFNCTNNRVAPGSVVHLSFKVIAVVPEIQKISFNTAANDRNKTRVRQAIERIVRSSSMEDLHDPNLNSIKRLIREEVNKIIGKSYVSEIVVNDFRMIEQ